MTEQWVKDALDSGIDDQLEMHYQPVVWLDSGKPYGAESFLRWHHPSRGIVGPMVWLPCAAANGEFARLARLVLGRWAFGPTAANQRISFNLGGDQLNDASTINDLLAFPTPTAQRLALEIHQLQFSFGEVDPSHFWPWEDVANLDDLLARLTNRGFEIWLDDFGEGSRNESTIAHPSVTVIKLDRCYLGEPHTVVTALVEKIHSEGKLVCVEAVETEDQRQFLLATGADLAQGFLYSRPLTADAFAAYLTES